MESRNRNNDPGGEKPHEMEAAGIYPSGTTAWSDLDQLLCGSKKGLSVLVLAGIALGATAGSADACKRAATLTAPAQVGGGIICVTRNTVQQETVWLRRQLSTLPFGLVGRPQTLLAADVPDCRPQVEEDERRKAEPIENRNSVVVALSDQKGLAIFGRYMRMGSGAARHRGRIDRRDQLTGGDAPRRCIAGGGHHLAGGVEDRASAHQR